MQTSYHPCVFHHVNPMSSHSHRTVLLMNPSEVPPEFLSVADQLSSIQRSQRETYITLVKHAYQATLGTKYPLASIHKALQVLDDTIYHWSAIEIPIEIVILAKILLVLMDV